MIGRIVEYRVEEHNLTGRGVIVEEKYVPCKMADGRDCGHWTFGIITWDYRPIDPMEVQQPYEILHKVTGMNVWYLWLNQAEISY